MPSLAVPEEIIQSDSAPEGSRHPPRYSRFTRGEKHWIVALIAFAAWFSTLSSFIYFPAITSLAVDLHTPVSKINLTITSYLIVSGVIPSITGDAADMFGRRPVCIACLAIYILANIGLAFQSSFPALFCLRMLQSAGISGTFAIAYGVVADIASPSERGSLIGVVSFGTNTAPSLGPVIGALLAAYLGWRSIFVFLSVMSGVCLILVVTTLPETARNVVGNGSIEGKAIHRLPFPRLFSTTSENIKKDESIRGRRHLPNPLTCIFCLFRKGTAIVIVCIAVLYMAYSCLQASLSSLFIETYNFTEMQAGFIYLPFGFGCAVAAYSTGRLLDRDYRLTAKDHSLQVDKVHGDDLLQFPIEAARLRSIFVPYSIGAAAVTGYGWSIQAKAHIAVPLVLQFIIGSMIQSCFTILSTLLVDLNPHSPSTAQASCNLIRCALAAIGLAVLQTMIESMGENGPKEDSTSFIAERTPDPINSANESPKHASVDYLH